MLPPALGMFRQLPLSPARDGVTYAAIQPVSWIEPTILERRVRPGVSPEEAAEVVAELLHDDYAYVFEAHWDLWTPPEDAEKWVLEPSLVRLVAHGMDFEERAAEETGHIQIDFGLDTPFLHEELEFTSEAARNVRSTVHNLCEFTSKVEKNAGATWRLLWCASE